MSTFEKFFAGAFALIAIYLLFNSKQAATVIKTIGSTGAGLFGTLQGRNANFGNGVEVYGGL